MQALGPLLNSRKLKLTTRDLVRNSGSPLMSMRTSHNTSGFMTRASTVPVGKRRTPRQSDTRISQTLSPIRTRHDDRDALLISTDLRGPSLSALGNAFFSPENTCVAHRSQSTSSAESSASTVMVTSPTASPSSTKVVPIGGMLRETGSTMLRATKPLCQCHLTVLSSCPECRLRASTPPFKSSHTGYLGEDHFSRMADARQRSSAMMLCR